MRVHRRYFGITTCLAFAIVANQASATVIVSSSVGGAPTGLDYANFDNLSLGNGGGVSGGLTVSFTGDAGVVQGSASGLYAAPYLSNGNGSLFGDSSNGPDSTKYLSTGIGTVTLTLPSLSNYIGLLWGSVDNYNSLELFNGNTLVGTVTGDKVTSSANGDQGVNGTYYVNINSDLAFNTVELLSTQYAFEADDIAYNPPTIQRHDDPVPEPSGLSLIAAGIAFLGLLGWRNKSGLTRAASKRRPARDAGLFFQARRPSRDRPRLL